MENQNLTSEQCCSLCSTNCSPTNLSHKQKTGEWKRQIWPAEGHKMPAKGHKMRTSPPPHFLQSKVGNFTLIFLTVTPHKKLNTNVEWCLCYNIAIQKNSSIIGHIYTCSNHGSFCYFLPKSSSEITCIISGNRRQSP